MNDETSPCPSLASRPARRERLVDAVDGVVVGQREQLDVGSRGVLDHADDRKVAVGVERVRLQVEDQGGELSETG